jgi:acyl-CoA thioester hydrolase
MTNTLNQQYPFVISQAIIWGDMDAYHHVNNTVYFRYFEDARVAFFQKAGVHDHMAIHNVGPILANTECNFRRPLTYPDRIHIGTRIELLAEKKFKMSYRIDSEQQQCIVAEGTALVVYYDYLKQTSCNIPELIRDALKALETSH